MSISQEKNTVASAEALIVADKIYAHAVCGKPRVVDGDTIRIKDNKIRLQGIDAPESKQTCKDSQEQEWKCGEKAKEYLGSLVGEGEVICFVQVKDKYKRSVSVCYNDKKQNVNLEMVKGGFAVAYVKYDNSYANEETWAKSNKLGIWEGSFKMPEEYRVSKKGQVSPAASHVEHCLSGSPPSELCSTSAYIEKNDFEHL